MYVKKSSIQGKGVFADKPIAAGSFIASMKGKIKTIEEIKGAYRDGTEREGDPLQISEEQYIDLDEPYVYLNHSCDPNAGIRKETDLVAIKYIQEGEEIVFDYSTTLWDGEWGDEFTEDWTAPCSCKSKKCRKIIDQFTTLPEEIKEYYYKQNALPDFIIRKWKK